MEYLIGILEMPELGIRKFGEDMSRIFHHVHDVFIPHPRNNYHPHILRQEALAVFSGALIAAKILTLGVLALGPVAPAYSSAITETNIIALTNQSRQDNGEAPLTENSELDTAAQAKADDMLAKGYFAHVTPDGRTPWSFITAAGYNYLMAGENLAVNFTEAEDVETAWMNSPDHRANLLNKDFQNIGIGISQGQYQGHNAIFVVQEFGTPAQQQIALSNTPTKVQTTTVPAPAATAAAAPAVTARGQLPAAPNVSGSSVTKETAPSVSPPVNRAPNAAVMPTSTLNQYQTLQDPAPASSGASINIEGGQVSLNKSNVDITAQVSGDAIKVLAYFGGQAIMLTAGDNNTWTGSVPVSQLAQTTTTVKLTATDINGQTANLQLADFSPDTMSNYNLLASAPKSYVTFLGQTFDPKMVENNFYLLFVACLLTSLVLAIAVKRHVQHLSLVANSSFVIILAMMLWRW
ncbi:MAG: CAP domain-containing protein [Candidatus Doudnabacteria bacterium]|nr:CAP domain-containing protein [Candidatus Doudnabacteria bacterium]